VKSYSKKTGKTNDRYNMYVLDRFVRFGSL